MSATSTHRADPSTSTPGGATVNPAKAKPLTPDSHPLKGPTRSDGPPRAKKTDQASKGKKRDTVAADVMRHPAVFCRVHDTLHEAARLMWEHDVGAIVVVNDAAEPVSVLTDRDTCMAAYTQGVALHHGTVASAMSKTLVTCTEATPVAEIRELMAAAQIRRLPVVDGQGRLVGVVGLRDIVAEAHAPLPKERKRGTSGPMLAQLVDALLQEPAAS